MKVVCTACGASVPTLQDSAFARCVCGNRIERDQQKPERYIPPWPLWATTLSLLRKPGEVGIGDTFHRLAESIGVEAVIKMAGINCGCAARREEWNQRWKYE